MGEAAQLAQGRRAALGVQGAVPADVGVHHEEGVLGGGERGRPYGLGGGFHHGGEPAHVHGAEAGRPRREVREPEGRRVLEVEVVARAVGAGVGDGQRGGQVAADAEAEVHPGGPQPVLDGTGEAVAAEAAREGYRGAEPGQRDGDVGRGTAELGGPHTAVPGHRDEVHERLADHQDRFGAAGHGSTTILRPMPALKRSMACGYCSSGSRSLMNTAGSSTPLAKSAAARS